jgi:predicted permease
VRLFLRKRKKLTDEEFAEEISAHIECETERLVCEGVPEEQARATAHKAFGNVARSRETFFEANHIAWLDVAGRDFRYVWRGIRSSVLCWTAVATIAVGIGIATTFFTLIDAVVLRPLPYRDPARLVILALVPQPSELRTQMLGASMTQGNNPLSYALTGEDLSRARALTTIFESIAPLVVEEQELYGTAGRVVSDSGGTQILHGGLAGRELFDTLGVTAARGRLLQAGDDSSEVVISDRLWKRELGGRPDVVGQVLRLASGPRTIVGVLPADFRLNYDREIDYWLPIPDALMKSTRVAPFLAIGRLWPSVRIAQANSALQSAGLGGDRRRQIIRPIAQPLGEWVSTRATPGLTLVGGTGALLLIVAFVNVGLLLLTRAMRKANETSMRTALGATRGRLLVESLVENSVLGVLGVLGGVFVAIVLFPIVRGFLPNTTPRLEEVVLGSRALGFAAAVGLVSTIAAAGLVHGSVTFAAAQRSLAAKDLWSTADRAGQRRRRLLIAAQAALIVALLTSTAILLRSFLNLTNVDLGFRTGGVMAIRMNLQPPAGVDAYEFWRRFVTGVRVESESLPGVAPHSVGLVSSLPFTDIAPVSTVRLPADASLYARRQVVTPEVFGILGARLLKGRLFNETDLSSGHKVAVVSQTMASRMKGDVVGQVLTMQEPYEIVGVVQDVRWAHPVLPPEPIVYLPYSELKYQKYISMLVATDAPKEVFAPAVRAAIRDVDDSQAVESVISLENLVGEATAPWRFYALSTATFSAVALFLATIGVIGAITASVAERRREIGIRMALGAQKWSVRRLMMRHAVVPMAFGVLGGLIAAAWSVRLLRRFLFEVSPFDPWSFALSALAMVAVGSVSAWLSTRGALRVDPVEILREG